MSNDIGFHFLVEINIAQEVLGCLTMLCVLNEHVSGFPSFFCCLVDHFPLRVLELLLNRWVCYKLKVEETSPVMFQS